MVDEGVFYICKQTLLINKRESNLCTFGLAVEKNNQRANVFELVNSPTHQKLTELGKRDLYFSIFLLSF